MHVIFFIPDVLKWDGPTSEKGSLWHDLQVCFPLIFIVLQTLILNLTSLSENMSDPEFVHKFPQSDSPALHTPQFA